MMIATRKRVARLPYMLRTFLLICIPVVLSQTAPAQKAAPDPGALRYVGSETCKGCHEEQFKGFERTAHWKTNLNTKHPEAQGCEGCHGPGADHVEGGGDVAKIINFTRLSREEANALCLSCHAENGKQAHFGSSSHASSNVSCVDCHSPHHAKVPQNLLIERQPKLCYGCHTTARSDFAKPFHHRVDEGLVQCEDCHNVHGGSVVRQVSTQPNGDAACFKCHADKQGPFIYEHVPVKTEGCTSCHTPHGSTNARLLRVSQVNLLCLQCHTFPTQGPMGPAHNQSQKYQACTMCHMAIHGSNFNPAFLK